MDLKLKSIKYLVYAIIFLAIFPYTSSVLSFTYPQTTTLSTTYKDILVVEKDGIYICDSSFSRIKSTLYSFTDEDKITTLSKLSTTIIKKSSYVTLILSNYKLYIIKTSTGILLYHSEDKLISGEEPKYVDLTYIYTPGDQTFYFTIGYISDNNYLKIKYYKLSGTYSVSINSYNTLSFNSVTRIYDGVSYTFSFQNKGLSCDYLEDKRSNSYNSYSYITCFIIANNGYDDYLIPILLDDESTSISLYEAYYSVPKIQVNNNKQIKTDTSGDMITVYVCYVTEQNQGICMEFYLDRSYPKGSFSSNKIIYSKTCRADTYGMKVTYIFETDEVLFSCSDLDGSLQVRIFGETNNYYKYENCDDINGYSVIYSSSSSNYYITSDVTCPKGKIPYDILIEPPNHVPDVITIITTTSLLTTIITEKVPETTIIPEKATTQNIPETSIVTETLTTQKAAETTTVTEIATTQKFHETTIVTEKLTTIVTSKLTESEKTKITQLIINERTENINDCPEKCLECNSEKKCTKCNKNKNYYPIELYSSSLDSSPSETIECITEETKKVNYSNYYLDNETESFKICYEKCSTCLGAGDGNNNNCKTCEPGYKLNPEYDNSTECIPKNGLYYIKYDQITSIDSDRCPEDFSYLVEEKGKCIENCKKDPKYKYTYEGLCYKEPPENTNDDNQDYKCEDNPNICVSINKKLYTLNEAITDQEIEILTFKYAEEFNYTNNHITIYENDIYKITIYKSGQCISDLGLLSKIIDFGDCYTDIKTKYQLYENTNLIVANIETKPGKEEYKKIPSYALYHPQTGVSLHYETECKGQKVTIQNNLTQELDNSKVSFGDIKLMADQGLDLFDPTCPFYNDLCTHYPDISNKDIPLKKRVLAYYPDIKLCDDYCDLTYIFLNNRTAKCECPISQEGEKNKLKDNSFYKNELSTFEEFIYLTNINVIKCYKDLFKYKYFIKNYGGFIILGLIFVQILCTLFYCMKSRLYLKKFIFSITSKFLNFLKAKEPLKDFNQKSSIPKGTLSKISIPPRKINKSKTEKVIKQNIPRNNNFNANSRNVKNAIVFSNSKEKLNSNKFTKKQRLSRAQTFKNGPINLSNTRKLSLEQSVSDNLMENITDEFDIYIEEFLKTDPEDMDYDDALRRDKRSFCRYYLEKIQSQQILVDTFFYKEYLKPRPIKIMLFLLQIELYFFINGLFYNEEYITKIFELQKDSIGNKTWRFLDNLFYAFLVGVIINYVIEFFFIREKKLRVTLKREKDNLLILKYEMIQIIKDVQTRFLSFIIISFIVSIFIWYHISCFNNVYTHMKEEWLIFSILIIVCIQIISLITSLIETILRFLSFRFKSEKLYKLSLIFS